MTGGKTEDRKSITIKGTVDKSAAAANIVGHLRIAVRLRQVNAFLAETAGLCPATTGSEAVAAAISRRVVFQVRRLIEPAFYTCIPRKQRLSAAFRACCDPPKGECERLLHQSMLCTTQGHGAVDMNARRSGLSPPTVHLSCFRRSPPQAVTTDKSPKRSAQSQKPRGICEPDPPSVEG